MLIVPIRHIERLTQLTRAEFCNLLGVIQEMVKHIKSECAADGYISIAQTRKASFPLSYCNLSVSGFLCISIAQTRNASLPLGTADLADVANGTFQSLKREMPLSHRRGAIVKDVDVVTTVALISRAVKREK